LYRLFPLGDGVHVIVKEDPKMMPQDEPPTFLEKMRAAVPQRDLPPVAANSAYTLDVMVAYTPSVADANADIEGLIRLATTETNEGYVNSKIPLTARLV